MKKLISLCIVHCALCIASAQTPTPGDIVDNAIERGLRFLAAGLGPDGRFDSDLGRQGTAVHGLVGMAFLAKGYVAGEGEYGDVLNRCVDAVISRADKNTGYMGGGHQNPMYAHSICTLFLSEVSHMVDPERQKNLEEVLEKATKIIIDAQNVNKDANNKGGWRYHPTSGDSDLSCTGWAFMALRSARLNGAPVPKSNIEEGVRYILRRHNEQSGTFGYQDNGSYAVTLSGMAILSLALSGEFNNPAVARGIKYLMTVYTQLPNQSRTFYGMYYTAQAMFQFGGDEWEMFSTWMYDYWIPRQNPEGFWDKGEEGCRYYQTAMVVLSFAVPYRQLPIYQRDETVDKE